MEEFQSIKIANIHTFKPGNIKNRGFWGEKCKEIRRGIYIYWLVGEKIPYPFKESPIFYIGKSKNLADRLYWHFTGGGEERLVEKREVSSWVYQNYFRAGRPFNITIFNIASPKLDEMEQLLIGIFVLEYGAMPLCNGRINRKRFRELYSSCPGRERRKIWSILTKAFKGDL